MDMGDNYKGLYRFLDYLHKAKVLNVMRASTKGDNIFTKPEKVYLNNTNLHHAYCEQHQSGTLREVFFASMINDRHRLSIPKKGDFLVDDKYLFEIHFTLININFLTMSFLLHLKNSLVKYVLTKPRKLYSKVKSILKSSVKVCSASTFNNKEI